MMFRNIITKISFFVAVFALNACDGKLEQPNDVITYPATDITSTSAITGGKLNREGSTSFSACGLVWGTQPGPTAENANCTQETADGNKFSCTLMGLSPDTEYYCRAYFKIADQMCYGDEICFRTLADDGYPIVKTTEATNVATNSAVVNGEVVSDGGKRLLDKGFVWSMTPDPTIETGKSISLGRGVGSMTTKLDGLYSDTDYYVRAYATNTKGTAYGESVKFSTLLARSMSFSIDGSIFHMIHVKGGTFQMGATPEQGADAQSYEKPVHSVTLDDYYIGMVEVTNELWEIVVNGRAPNYQEDPLWPYNKFKPAVKKDWSACMDFVEKLSKLTGKRFTLPTEAQWEYAARGGVLSAGFKYSGSNEFNDVGWSKDNPMSGKPSELMVVGSKKPNELGIYDMSGNAMEWCSDWYSDYTADSQVNPTGPEVGDFKVLRGGSFKQVTSQCRVAHRGFGMPTNPMSFVGLRLAMVR